MTGWSVDELARIGGADELELASRRPDGSLRPFVTIWVVRSADDVYVRSADGYDNPWFQRALASREGRIRAGGVERDVAFEEPASGVDADVDTAYHAKRPLRTQDGRDGGLARGHPVDTEGRAALRRRRQEGKPRPVIRSWAV